MFFTSSFTMPFMTEETNSCLTVAVTSCHRISTGREMLVVYLLFLLAFSCLDSSYFWEFLSTSYLHAYSSRSGACVFHVSVDVGSLSVALHISSYQNLCLLSSS